MVFILPGLLWLYTIFLYETYCLNSQDCRIASLALGWCHDCQVAMRWYRNRIIKDLPWITILGSRLRLFANNFIEWLASRVTQKSFFMVTNVLFNFSRAILCHEHTIPLKTIIDRWFHQSLKTVFSALALWCHHNWFVASRERGVLVFGRHIRRLSLHEHYWITTVNIDFSPPGIHGLACTKWEIFVHKPTAVPLLPSFSFNPSMKKQSNIQENVGLHYIYMPKLQWCNRWSLGKDKEFQTILYNGCNYVSMQGLKLSHNNKRGHWSVRHGEVQNTVKRTNPHTLKNVEKSLCIGTFLVLFGES